MSKITVKQNNTCESTYKSFKDIRGPADINISKNFRATSLDSLANSSHPSDSDESHDSDSDSKSKNSFAVKCEVYSDNVCGSIRSWTKSDGSNSENSYDYISNESCNDKKNERNAVDKRLEMVIGRMETIPEEGVEPKVSVKEILARFENLKGSEKKDSNNNNQTNLVNSADGNQMEIKETVCVSVRCKIILTSKFFFTINPN